MTSKNVTVTISLYNKENTIDRAVKSILNQPDQPAEIIIVDDGSTDGGSEIAKALSDNYSNISYIYQKNSGVSVARNRGVAEAKTEFVSFLDADDAWEPEYISNLTTLINSAEEADFYSLAYQMHSSEGVYKPYVALPDNFVGIVQNPLKIYSKGYGLIHTSAICFRKPFFEKLGGFPEGVNFGEDLYLWLKACIEGSLAFNNKTSVTLFKEPVNSINRRKLSPYHVSYFTGHLHEYSKKNQKELRRFLIKNIYFQWAAAKTEKNRQQRNTLLSYCFKLSFPAGLLLGFCECIPGIMFDFIRKVRVKNRIKNNRFKKN